jgi:hypothetical protein
VGAAVCEVAVCEAADEGSQSNVEKVNESKPKIWFASRILYPGPESVFCPVGSGRAASKKAKSNLNIQHEA